jgi:ribonuclease BN (tRNA processing enzyme)
VGDGLPSAGRNHSSFLYRFEKQSVLIDCGEPISRSYKASGLDYNLMDGIFVSHLHFDHFGGLFMLVQGLWLEGRKKELCVHMPSDGIAAARRMFEVGCIFDELLPFRLSYEPLQAGRPVTLGEIRVTPCATSHLASAQERFQTKHPQRFEAFSFLLESAGHRVGHSADIGAVEDLAPLVEKPLHLLVCELAHVHPRELFLFLRERDIRRILLVHLAREWVERSEEVEALAVELLGRDRVGWPHDGQELDFG